VQRGLLRFDLASGPEAIPQGAMVLEARLRLYNTTSDHRTIQIAAYGLKRDWVEGEANWQVAAQAAGASWGAPGADDTLSDRDATYEDSVLLAAVGWHEWDLAGLVQRWAQDPGSNHGILLVGGEGASVQYRFVARELPGSPNGPQLLVSWRPFEPTATPIPTPTATETPHSSGVLQGHVFEDLNRDGRPDPGEGVAGAIVQAHREDPPTPYTTCPSDAEGNYRCVDLAAGWYWLRLVSLPGGYRPVSASDIRVLVEVDATPGGADFFVRSVEDGPMRLMLPLVLR
jgi:hypothetical protein